MDLTHKTIPEIKKLLGAVNIEDRIELFVRLENDPRAGVKKLAETYRREAARIENEERFQEKLMQYERRLYAKGFRLVAGVDEAGRGALAGPLVAAAVILPKDIRLFGLRESKQLTAEQRETFYVKVTDIAVAWKTVRIEHDKIDANGIQWANLRALELASCGLEPAAEYILSDAFDLKTLDIPHLAITKGDCLSSSIAAASVIAKVTRDRIMQEYHSVYPNYGFSQNKGYGTAQHIEALEQYGPSPIHRRYFAPVSQYKQLSF